MSYLEKLLPEFRKGAKIRREAWSDDFYIYLYQGEIYWSDKAISKNVKVTTAQALIPILTSQDNDWEFYQEPEIDWDYIIKNKCLCWFWCGIGKTKYLNYLQAKEEHTFRDELGSCWENCRPVRRDEVTFYEDRKDE